MSSTTTTNKPAAGRTKVVVRNLPPTLGLDAFQEVLHKHVAPDSYTWLQYYPGKIRCPVLPTAPAQPSTYILLLSLLLLTTRPNQPTNPHPFPCCTHTHTASSAPCSRAPSSTSTPRRTWRSSRRASRATSLSAHAARSTGATRVVNETPPASTLPPPAAGWQPARGRRWQLWGAHLLSNSRHRAPTHAGVLLCCVAPRRCTVEYAPFQKVPSTRTKKLPMEGTIEKGGCGLQQHTCFLTLGPLC